MIDASERLIPNSVTLEHQFPPEVRAILQDLHNDRHAIGEGALIALALLGLAVLKYVFGTGRKSQP